MRGFKGEIEPRFASSEARGLDCIIVGKTTLLIEVGLDLVLAGHRVLMVNPDMEESRVNRTACQQLAEAQFPKAKEFFESYWQILEELPFYFHGEAIK